MTGMRLLLLLLAALSFGCAGIRSPSASMQHGAVIEVVTFQLREGVDPIEFRSIDRAVESQHVARQPGFLSRQSASGDGGHWLVLVHWRSAEDADASMARFAEAPATAQFLSSIQADTMTMKRYTTR